MSSRSGLELSQSAMSQSVPSIVLLSEAFPPAVGGSGVLLANTYSRIVGRSITVLTNALPDADSQLTYPSLRVVREPLSWRRWGVSSREALAQHWRVAQLIRRHASRRRTVVHCGRSLPEGVAALLARLAGGPRYVCWTHGEDIATAQTSREFSLLTRMVYRWASGALANSYNTARVLEGFGIKRDSITVAHPGVDGERFHPGVDGRPIRSRLGPADAVIVLSVGRLQRRKGHDVALAAIAALQHRLPSLRYVIVGSGEEQARLEALIAEYGIGERVTMIGEVPDADLPAYYAACDVFLMPNRIEGSDFEGFGIVFLEAAAMCKPSIGGRSGGVPEAVEDGVTGFLVEGTDVAELAHRIEELINNADLRRRLGEAGRERVLERFTWQRAAVAVTAIHDGILAHEVGSGCNQPK